MRIGVPKEIKDHESRVSLTPAGVRELVAHGHEVVVETRAGNGSGYDDAQYTAAGAKLLPTADAVFEAAQLIVKVNEAVFRTRLAGEDIPEQFVAYLDVDRRKELRHRRV